MHLSENVVKYSILVVPEKASDERQRLDRLDAVQEAARRLVDTVANAHIWQRASFCLTIARLETADRDDVHYLRGATDCGESMEDEWLIVWILRSLTTTFPDVWAQVSDGDGEFLLVEAAAVVPRWMGPDLDQNRVWLHKGSLLIIPPQLNENQAQCSLTLAQSLQLITAGGVSALIHDSSVESEAFSRLDRYPQQISESVHRALFTIPRKLAWVLLSMPKAVAPAIEAFCLHDMSLLRRLASPHYKWQFLADDLVTISVRLTRLLYAQLRSEKLETGLFGADFYSAPLRHLRHDTEREEIVRLEGGTKLAIGFELLMASAEVGASSVAGDVLKLIKDHEEIAGGVLPTDRDILSWEGASLEDEDGWMNVTFEDLDAEPNSTRPGNDRGNKSGLADIKVEADIGELVSKFEAFFNDEDAGLDGADTGNSTDNEDSSDATEGEEGEAGGGNIRLDEAAFEEMMREMLGLPPDDLTRTLARGSESSNAKDEEEEVLHVADLIEAELQSYGALDSSQPECADSSTRMGGKPQMEKGGKSVSTSDAGEVNKNPRGDGADDIRFNLAVNLLKGFKGQGGLPGPISNMLGMMDVRLPRDEEGDLGDGTNASEE